MNGSHHRRLPAVVAMLSLAALASGCSRKHCARYMQHGTPSAPQPQGYAADPYWKLQETGGEASDFVVYDHEFVGNTHRLNAAGQDHVRQIATRLVGSPFPVIVERSETSVDPESQYKYPVHHDPELDLRRREVVARALAAMGVADADQRVVVAPALAEGHEGVEAERAYARGLNPQYNYGYGYGAFGGGFFGGFGGFGL